MIEEFRNDIYPISLFVYKINEDEDQVEVLSNRFKTFKTDCETEYKFEPIEPYSSAYTCFVIDKETSRRGPLVVVRDDVFNSSICHESVHAADVYCKLLGIITQDFQDTNEPYVYLVEYLFRSIELVLKGKNF